VRVSCGAELERSQTEL